MKPKYVVLDYPSYYLDKLRACGIIEMVTEGCNAVVARKGVNRRTLKKILRDEVKRG